MNSKVARDARRSAALGSVRRPRQSVRPASRLPGRPALGGFGRCRVLANRAPTAAAQRGPSARLGERMGRVCCCHAEEPRDARARVCKHAHELDSIAGPIRGSSPERAVVYSKVTRAGIEALRFQADSYATHAGCSSPVSEACWWRNVLE